MNCDLAQHLPLVRRVAGRMMRRLPRSVQLDDLVSAGTEGLVDAARRFDPDKGVAFGAYAEIRIRGAVLDELRQYDFVPRSVRRRQRAYEAARQQAAAAGTPTDEVAVSHRLGVAPEDLADWLGSAQVRICSLDDPDAQVLADGGEGALDALERKQRLARLRSAVAALPERLQTVLGLYYVEDLTLKEIGGILGVTESRVCQLHGRALARIRAEIAGGEARKAA